MLLRVCYVEYGLNQPITYSALVTKSQIWYGILRWLGVELVPPRGVLRFFEAFLGMGRGRKDILGWLLIWQTIVWTIWKSRNDVFFSEGTFSVECLVDRVKLLSWKWFLGKNLDAPCSSYEWVSILFYVETDRVYWGVVFGSRWVRRIGGPLVTLTYLRLIIASLFLGDILPMLLFIIDSYVIFWIICF
jgi:hypothetical protein